MNEQGRLCPRCRAARLSRYNAEPFCAVCVRTAKTGTITDQVWVWDSEAMRHALARLNLPAALAILRTSAGLTQCELAQIVPGWTQPMVTRMESGARDTLYDIRALLSFADAIDMPREVLLPLILGDPDASWEVTAQTGVQEDGVDRRTFTSTTLAAASGLIMPSWISAPPKRVTDAHLRLLRSSSVRLSVQEQM